MNTHSSQRNLAHPATVSIWSVDRIARLIVGISNIFLLLAIYFISPYFMIGLAFINLNLIFTSVTDNCPFKKLLKRLGAKERESFFNAKGDLIIETKNHGFTNSIPSSENS